MKLKSTKDWIKVDDILDDGYLKCKDDIIKILEVIPINFNFKSDSEKEVILENYKNLFKNINFNIQICIYSQKESIKEYIDSINCKSQKEKEIKEEYEKFINDLINENKIYFKRFFIVISFKTDNLNNIKQEIDFKISIIKNIVKNTNDIKEIKTKEEMFKILKYVYR